MRATGTSTILDSSGNGLSGTPYGSLTYTSDVPCDPIPLTGISNKLALAFDGSSGRIFIPDNSLLALTDSLTLEAFIYATAIPPGLNHQGQIIMRGDDRPGLDPYQLMLVGGSIYFRVQDGNDNYADAISPVALNAWHHVAGTLNGATGVMSLYVDGVLVAQTTTGIRPLGSLTGQNPGVGIGNVQSANYNEYFPGLIDEVRISDSALNPDELLNATNILSAIPNTNILETALWQHTPTFRGDGYTFGLSNAPAGMMVDSSGTISWTPTEAQGPSTNGPITFAIFQASDVVAWTNFTVIVLESNLPPVFTNFPATQVVYATTTVSVNITATDPDVPANALTYALDSAPPGVSINPNTGLLTWTPTSGQVGTNTIAVSVTDYNPWAVNSQQLGVTNSFMVIVNGLLPPMFLQAPPSQVVGFGKGFAFVSLAAGFPPPTYQWQFSTDSVSFVDINGATEASYQLASSTAANLGYYRVVISNSQGTNISDQASLSYFNARLLPAMLLYGPVGANYNIQSTPALGGGSNWTTISTVTLPASQPYIYVDPGSLTNSQQFYRAVPQ